MGGEIGGGEDGKRAGREDHVEGDDNDNDDEMTMTTTTIIRTIMTAAIYVFAISTLTAPRGMSRTLKYVARAKEKKKTTREIAG